MAGFGIAPEDFALFDIGEPSERAEALEKRLRPKLDRVGEDLRAGLSRVVGQELFPHPGRLPRRKGLAPEEMFIAFCDDPKNLRGIPCLALAVTREQLHARVAVHGESPRLGPMRTAVQREAANLARKGKPFRKLRDYVGWNYEELPEIAPAHFAAFWLEVAKRLGPARSGRLSGFDLGLAWSREEARSLSVGDVLGAFRDLAPLFKLLANAG